MAFSGSAEPTPQPDAFAPPSGSPASGSSGAPKGSGSPADRPEPDWTDQVTDLVVDTVDKVRARTTGPILNVAHAAVYGIVAAIVLLPILVAFFAGLVKGLNWLIPGDVWIVYCIIAGLLWLGGWALWLQRDRSGSADT